MKMRGRNEDKITAVLQKAEGCPCGKWTRLVWPGSRGEIWYLKVKLGKNFLTIKAVQKTEWTASRSLIPAGVSLVCQQCCRKVW